MTKISSIEVADLRSLAADAVSLSACEAGFYLRLVMHNLLGPSRFVPLNYSQLARIGGCTDTSVKKYLKALAELGLIIVQEDFDRIELPVVEGILARDQEQSQ